MNNSKLIRNAEYAVAVRQTAFNAVAKKNSPQVAQFKKDLEIAQKQLAEICRK